MRCIISRIQHDGRTAGICPSRCEHQRGVDLFHDILESSVIIDLWAPEGREYLKKKRAVGTSPRVCKVRMGQRSPFRRWQSLVPANPVAYSPHHQFTNMLRPLIFHISLTFSQAIPSIHLRAAS